MPDSEAQRHAIASPNIGNALSLFSDGFWQEVDPIIFPLFASNCFLARETISDLQFYALSTFRHTQVLLRGAREHGAGEILVLLPMIVVMDGYSLWAEPRDMSVRRLHLCERIFMQSHHHKLSSLFLAPVFTNYVRLLRVQDSSSAQRKPLFQRDWLSPTAVARDFRWTESGLLQLLL